MPEQREKAAEPTTSSPSARCRVVMPLQPSNAYAPMDLTLAGMRTTVMSVRSMYASSWISTVPSGTSSSTMARKPGTTVGYKVRPAQKHQRFGAHHSAEHAAARAGEVGTLEHDARRCPAIHTWQGAEQLTARPCTWRWLPMSCRTRARWCSAATAACARRGICRRRLVSEPLFGMNFLAVWRVATVTHRTLVLHLHVALRACAHTYTHMPAVSVQVSCAPRLRCRPGARNRAHRCGCERGANIGRVRRHAVRLLRGRHRSGRLLRQPAEKAGGVPQMLRLHRRRQRRRRRCQRRGCG